jgi:hypothetical protein
MFSGDRSFGFTRDRRFSVFAIADEGVALSSKIIGKFRIKKRNQMLHPCEGGVGGSGSAMGVLHAIPTPKTKTYSTQQQRRPSA